MRIPFLNRRHVPQPPAAVNDGPARLIIHAGTHKTGTTSIQNVLAAYRDQLGKQGLIYPDHGPYLGGSREAHHTLAQAFVGTDPAALDAAHRFVETLKSTVNHTDILVISFESIYRHVCDTQAWTTLPNHHYWDYRICYLQRLYQAFSDMNPEILLYLRRHDEFAESAYKEWIINKSDVDISFYDWIEEYMPLMAYNHQISTFQAVFPTVNVESYEKAKQEGLLSAFFRQLAPIPPPRGANRRRSPDSRLILWIRLSSSGTWRKRCKFAASEVGTSLFTDRRNPSLWASTDDRDAFLQRFTEGPYGTTFFDPPTTGPVDPARLPDDELGYIDDVFSRWLKDNPASMSEHRGESSTRRPTSP
jgi:hypothetical protein